MVCRKAYYSVIKSLGFSNVVGVKLTYYNITQKLSDSGNNTATCVRKIFSN